MANFAWPGNLEPTAFGFFHVDADMSGGASIGGGEQYVVSPGPRWGASMTLPIIDAADVYSIRALRSQLIGRANGVVLPTFDRQRAPWPVAVTMTAEEVDRERDRLRGEELARRLAELKTRTFLELDKERSRIVREVEQQEFDIRSRAVGDIDAKLVLAAAIRATTIKFDVFSGGTIKAGMQFQLLGASRLYEIARIVTQLGNEYDIEFQPPLRAAAAANTVVNFETPVCVMRCLNLNDELRKLDLLRFAVLNLEFVELL